MAYMDQERKRCIAPKVKAILNRYGLKGRLGVHHHSTLILNIQSGKLDFFGQLIAQFVAANNTDQVRSLQTTPYWQVNEYHIEKTFSGDCAAALLELKAAMNQGNHDRSDIQTDYFDVGWWTRINLGKWDKPYELIT